MNERGLRLLAAHIRSLDPGEPTATERLEATLGKDLAWQLLRHVGDLRRGFTHEVERGNLPDLSG